MQQRERGDVHCDGDADDGRIRLTTEISELVVVLCVALAHFFFFFLSSFGGWYPMPSTFSAPASLK